MTKNTLFAILQQIEYDLPRFQAWAKAHQDDTQEIQPEKWTAKLRLINALSNCFFFLPAVSRLTLATQIVTPFENAVRHWIYFRASWKLRWYKLRGLTVVAIAGSYAKTSTKHILEHSLSADIPTLITPKSYNTLLGISGVIRTQLKPEHKLFIVEFGEHYPQDIAHLTTFIKPHLGILTPLGRQHLEVIGGFENVLKSFSYFANYFAKKPERLLIAESTNQQLTAANLLKTQVATYGTQPSATYRVFNTKISRAGTEYEIMDQTTHQTYQVFSPLFGEHQAVNSLTSIWLATKLNLTLGSIVKRLSTMPYIERRHQPTFAENNVLVLDNSYNTNADSVTESLKLVNQLEPTHRIIVTLGFTELGNESEKIHREFGKQLAKTVDYVGLIKAPWTEAIMEGFTSAGGKKDHVKVGPSQEAAFAQVQQYVIPGSIVLFEGGYREVYI
jgi:UDP-N-acetylmuramoyl-tripeptide--D-alanyl-D-alanine ligase